MDVPVVALLIPIAGIIFVTLMIVAIVAIVHWHKARDKELQYHQDLRLREMEHLRKMKEQEIELEKVKARGGSSQAA